MDCWWSEDGKFTRSHLTFQEYFTARNFVANSDPQVLDKNLIQLVSHMTEPGWREVLYSRLK